MGATVIEWPGRTGATAGQVDAFPVGPARHFGHQPASRVGEGLAGPAVPIGGVAHGFATTEPVLALASTSSNAPRLSGALPGNTSTAVINWESVSPQSPPCAR